MPVIRKQIDRNFTIFPNDIIYDKELSLKAKGLLLLLLSRPDEWEFYMNEITKHSKDGKDSVRGGLNELFRSGYMEKKRVKDAETGHFTGWEYIVRNTKNTEIGNPDVGKPAIINTEEENNTEKREYKAPAEKPLVPKDSYGEDLAVKLTYEEHAKLIAKLGTKRAERYIASLNDYLCSTGKRYKSHYHTILGWVRKDEERGNELRRGGGFSEEWERRDMEKTIADMKRDGTWKDEYLSRS